MQLRGRTRRSGDGLVVELDGDADLATAPDLAQVLSRAIDDAEAAGAALTVDLDGLVAVDFAALGLLVGSAADARRRGVAFSLLCTGDRRRARLTDTRIDRIVEVIPPHAPPIFHLAVRDDWSSAQSTGVYEMSTRGRTVDDEGFVHCSFTHQLRGVARRFYDDVDELIVLHIDRAAVESDLRVEPAADDLDERFPHVYRSIAVDEVTATTAWRRGADGWGSPPVSDP